MTFVCLIKTWKVCLNYYSEETNEKNTYAQVLMRKLFS